MGHPALSSVTPLHLTLCPLPSREQGNGSECSRVLMQSPRMALPPLLKYTGRSQSHSHPGRKESHTWNMPVAGRLCVLLKSGKWVYYQNHCHWREPQETIHGKFFQRRMRWLSGCFRIVSLLSSIHCPQDRGMLIHTEGKCHFLFLLFYIPKAFPLFLACSK